MERYQHRKGGTYEALGKASIQTDTPLQDYDQVMVYRSEEDQSIWVRPLTEFEDGRFTNIPPKTLRVDPRTGRTLGDHGTAQQAVDWILNAADIDDRLQASEFLNAWQEGELFEEWPEFYEWLAAQQLQPVKQGPNSAEDRPLSAAPEGMICSAGAKTGLPLREDYVTGPSTPPPSPHVTGTDAQKRIYQILAEEGGGTWATYTMMEIEAAFSPAPQQQMTGDHHELLMRLQAVQHGTDRPYAASVAKDAGDAIKALVSRLADVTNERDNLSSIVASGIDEIAGAALDDAEETIQRLISKPSTERIAKFGKAEYAAYEEAQRSDENPSPQTNLRAPELTNEQKEMTLLRIIEAMKGTTDSSENQHSWLNWFCSDEIHNVQEDTFNRCNDKGWLHTTHNSDWDTSTTTLTAAGRAALAATEGSNNG